MAKQRKEKHVLNLGAAGLAAVLALLLALPLAAEEVIYTWTDEAGVRHFSAQPPQGREFRIVRTLSPSSASPGQREPAPDPAPPTALPEISQAEPDPEVVRQRCEQALQNLELLQLDRPAMLSQEEGEPIPLDDAARQDLIEETERFIDEWC